jgi:hypothetical protein
MRHGDHQEAACTVIVTVDAPLDIMGDLVAHARVGIERFGDCPGFIDGILHVSQDGRRLVQYLRWASDSEYEACRDDPRWDALPTTARFMALVSSEAVTLDARVYAVVERSP